MWMLFEPAHPDKFPRCKFRLTFWRQSEPWRPQSHKPQDSQSLRACVCVGQTAVRQMGRTVAVLFAAVEAGQPSVGCSLLDEGLQRSGVWIKIAVRRQFYLLDLLDFSCIDIFLYWDDQESQSCFLVLDWSHSAPVSGETHPEAQETVTVGRPGPLRRHQHQPGVRERLPQRQSPQSRCCPTPPGPLTVQPRVPGPPSRHPKLQRHHRAQQHSATHSDDQTGLRSPESDCQRHELRGEQGRGEGFRKKRRAPEDLTRRRGRGRQGGQSGICSLLFFPLFSPPHRLKRRSRLLADRCRHISARMTDKSAAK